MQNKHNISIADFLPKYPYIKTSDTSDTIQNKYNVYNNIPFETAIFNKKEFHDNILKKIEKKPEKKGDLMNHQKNVARYMSVVTPYDGLLLFHAMGTGKACVAVGVGEHLRAQENNVSKKIKGMIFLARGPNILNNLAKELVYVCTDGRYIPEDIESIKPEMRMAKIKRSLLPFYGFYTIDKFLKSIKNLSDEQIESRFANYAFCIDEVHNLRTKDSSNKSVVSKDYNLIHTFLHKVKHKKVILLSGTPMADLPSEIADIMNLILPLSQQMPTGNNFDDEFLIQNKALPLIYNINPDSSAQLKSFFKGRVSYLKTPDAATKVEYVGDKIGVLQHLNLYLDNMNPSEIQNEAYLSAYRKDKQRPATGMLASGMLASAQPEQTIIELPLELPLESSNQASNQEDLDSPTGTTGLFHNSQQASIAVFPNGTYGSTGFNQYIVTRKSTNLLKAQGIQFTDYVINKKPIDKSGKPIPSLIQYLNMRSAGAEGLSDLDNKLNQLSKISVKFANVISMLLDRVNNKKGSSFVYCNWVTGSGCIYFSKILELFGFKKANGDEKTQGLRYALLTSAVATDNQISSLIERFNRPDNMNGEIINVVIGSKIISEGVTFKNVQDVHVLSPHWNYTVTEQALSRAIRAFSHDLIKKYIKDFTVKVFLHATIPSQIDPLDPSIFTYDIDQSIDIDMYEKSEHKDITIKQIENVIKQSAFDCALNYNRNYRGNTHEDGSRECDYGKCNYKCDGIDLNIVNTEQRDLSTYRLYYQHDRVIYLIRSIKGLFRHLFSISFAQLQKQYGVEYTQYELLSALSRLIDSRVPIYNKYGFFSYIATYNNFYFLVNSPINNNSILSTYYTKYPSIHSSETLNDIAMSQDITNYPKIIQKMCAISNQSTDSTDQVTNMLTKLPMWIQELLLESSYISKLQPNTTNIQTNLGTIILSIMKYYLFIINIDIKNGRKEGPVPISVLLYATETGNNRFRYFDINDMSWKNATDEIAKQCDQIIDQLIQRQQSSPYEWYGIFGYDKFYLKHIQKKGAQNKGENCLTMDMWKLYNIIFMLNKKRIIRDGDTELPDVSKNKMLEFLNPTDSPKPTQFQLMLKGYPDSQKKIKSNQYNDGLRSVWWYAMNKVQKQRLCKDIKEMLGNEQYIVGEYITAKQKKITQPTGKKSKKLSRNRNLRQ